MKEVESRARHTLFQQRGSLTQHRDGVTSLSKETIGSTESEIMRNTVKIPIIGARAQPLGQAPLVKIGAFFFVFGRS